jgi:hypothetical protein
MLSHMDHLLAVKPQPRIIDPDARALTPSELNHSVDANKMVTRRPQAAVTLSDLPHQLRMDANEIGGWGAGNEAERVRQAADEIERLRAALSHIENMECFTRLGEEQPHVLMMRAAHEALKPSELNALKPERPQEGVEALARRSADSAAQRALYWAQEAAQPGPALSDGERRERHRGRLLVGLNAYRAAKGIPLLIHISDERLNSADDEARHFARCDVLVAMREYKTWLSCYSDDGEPLV